MILEFWIMVIFGVSRVLVMLFFFFFPGDALYLELGADYKSVSFVKLNLKHIIYIFYK